MLYEQKSVKSVSVQLITILSLSLIVLIGGIIAGIVISVNGEKSIGAAIGTVSICIFIFLLGNFIMPCYNYYKYLVELFRGRKCKRGGIIKSISKKPIYKDNKNYYYEIDVEIEKDMYAMLMYDANLGVPPMQIGDEKSFVCYENYIVKIER